jgi:hypothetical protein
VGEPLHGVYCNSGMKGGEKPSRLSLFRSKEGARCDLKPGLVTWEGEMSVKFSNECDEGIRP